MKKSTRKSGPAGSEFLGQLGSVSTADGTHIRTISTAQPVSQPLQSGTPGFREVVMKAYTWTKYYLNICDAIAQNSKCHSRQIGAILVQDKVIVATGYNGPPRGVSHCEGGCPRRAAGYRSGEGLDICPATHAEQNCIASAARVGAHTNGATLYINTVSPCKWCMGLLINAGVFLIITKEPSWYDSMAQRFAKESGVTVVCNGVVLR